MNRRQTQWVSDPEEIWGPWIDTGLTRDRNGRREEQQKSTSNMNNVRYQWVDVGPTPPVIIWGDWENTGQTQISEGWYWEHQRRESNQGDFEYRWVKLAMITWSVWADTGRTRGNPDDDEEMQKEQKRTPNYGSPEFRWVFDRLIPVVEMWGDWEDTGDDKIEGGWYWKEQVSHSDLGNTKYQWVKVAQITWGRWINTGRYRTNPENHEEELKEQRRTPNYGDTEYRWVFHRFIPDVEEWDEWEPTDTTRGSLGDRERLWERSSNLGGYQTEWRPDPEDIEWTDWEDTGNYRGSGSNREKEQRRSSNYGGEETRWVPGSYHLMGKLG